MITIVDYGVGNIRSIQNMFKKIGEDAVVATSENDIKNASKLILPGVGAFDTCAEKLAHSGLQPILHKKVIEEHTPVLGICVGMQLMTEGSEEGALPGLGWIKGRTVRFNPSLMPTGTKIPHMGWADVEQVKPSRLFDSMYSEPRFYFVHSYYVQAADNADVLAQTKVGTNITVAIERNNITAVQFHPEKSHKHGMKLLENFALHY